jgi:hypothetical protein
MRRAKAMRPSIAARPPKRYGTGECHAECATLPAAAGATTAFAAAAAVALIASAPGLIASAVLGLLLRAFGFEFLRGLCFVLL